MRRLTILLSAVLFCFQGTFVVHEAQAEPAAVPSPEAMDVLALGQPVSEEGLARLDGRQDTQIDQLNLQMSDIKNNANVAGNTLSAVNSNLTTGLNSIGQQAFANATGIVTVIQNSGNQVLIQNDMLLNLSVK